MDLVKKFLKISTIMDLNFNKLKKNKRVFKINT